MVLGDYNDSRGRCVRCDRVRPPPALVMVVMVTAMVVVGLTLPHASHLTSPHLTSYLSAASALHAKALLDKWRPASLLQILLQVKLACHLP